MARPQEQGIKKAAQSLGQLRRFCHPINADKVFGTHSLPTRDDVAQSERIIPTSRWRVMSLDIAKAQASGLGWHYTGIVVGKRPKARETAKPPNPQAKPPVPQAKPPKP